MKRPFEDRRPAGPFVKSTLFQQDDDFLIARKQCSPEIRLELAEVHSGVSDELFDLIDKHAKFNIDDVLVGREEGQLGTREPLTTTVQIITDDKEVELEDLNHMVNVIENRYTVFESIIGASVEVDPQDHDLGFIPTEFTEESTEVE